MKVQNKGGNTNWLAAFLPGCGGVFTVLWAVTNTLDVEYPYVPICLFLAFASLGICFWKGYLNRRIVWMYLPVILTAFFLRRELWLEGTRVVNGVLSDLTEVYQFPEGFYVLERSVSHTTELVLLVMTAFLILFLQLLSAKKGRTVAAVVLFLLTVSGVVLGHKLPAGLIFLMVVVLTGILFPADSFASKKKTGKFLALTVLFLFLAGSFACSFLLASDQMLARNVKLSLNIKNRIQPDGLWSGSAVRDTVSRGNRVTGDRVCMTVTLEKKPMADFYLKGFTGTQYDGRKWSIADERAFTEEQKNQYLTEGRSETENVADVETFSVIGNRSSGYLNQWIWNRLYGRMRREYQNVSERYEAQRAQITELQTDHYEYRPYFSQSYGASSDTYSLYTDKPQERIRNLSGNSTFDDQEKFLDAYQAYVNDTYLSVSDARIPKLEAFCKAHPQEWDISAIIDFVRKTLWSETSYTLSPGKVPAGKETVDYFLFENKKGYCIHYATTSVLMCRIYGIPARYVSGYMIQPEQFEKQADGSYQAKVRESDSHAWMEVYERSVGWYPVEMTPSDASSGETAQDAQTNPRAETPSPQPEKPSQTEQTQKEQKQEETPTDDGKDTNNKKNPSVPRQKVNTQTGFLVSGVRNALMLGIVLCVLLVLTGYFCRRRLWRMDVQKVFAQFLRLLHRRYHMTEYFGQEEDFADVLCERIPVISREEASQMIRILQREAFSTHAASDQETAFVCGLYLKALRYTYRRWPFSGILLADSRRSF